MELHYIPLDHLTVAKTNARTHGATRELGLADRQHSGAGPPATLAGPAFGRGRGRGLRDHWRQRRYLACQRLAQDAPVEPLPCLVLATTDDAAALAISLAENVERLPMEPFDQHEAFARLVKLGQGVDAIAARFGVTERLVKQRLALAGLIDGIKREARQGEIGIADAQVLALATPRQQRGSMGLLSGQRTVRAAGKPVKSMVVRRRGDGHRGGAVPLGVLPGPDRRRPVRARSVFRRRRAVLDAATPGHRRAAGPVAGRGLGRSEGAGNRRVFPQLGTPAEAERTRRLGVAVATARRRGDGSRGLFAAQGRAPPSPAGGGVGGEGGEQARPSPSGARPPKPCKTTSRCTRWRRCGAGWPKTPLSPCGWRWRA